MLEVQKRWKAVLAAVSTGVAQAIAFAQANQNVTLKDVLVSVAVALGAGAVVHQVPNKK